MAAKSLTVLGNEGAGKKTLVGSLIYKCGLEMLQLEELEREGVRDFAEIPPFYEKAGLVQSFHAPSGRVTIGNSMTPDVAIWVVDATELSAQKLTRLLSAGSLQPQEKLVVLVNKMDTVSWSESVFDEAVREFGAIHLKGEKERAYIIPVSIVKDENLLSTPQVPSWVRRIPHGQQQGSVSLSGQPLMQLL